MVGKALLIALGGASFVLLTRFLGPSGFGAYSVILAVVAITLVFCDLGVESTALREVAKRPNQAVNLISSVTALGMTLSAALFVGIAIGSITLWAAGVRYVGGPVAVNVAALALLATPFRVTVNTVARTSLRTGMPTALDVVARAVSLALIVGAIWKPNVVGYDADSRLVFVLVAMTIPSVLSSLVAWCVISLRHSLRVRWKPSEMVGLLTLAVPLAVLMVLNTAYYRIDTVLLSIIAGSTQVAYYSVGVKLVDVSVGFIFPVAALAFPSLARKAYHSPSSLGKALAQTVDVLLMLGMTVAVFGALYAPQLVRILAGPRFSSASAAFAILAVSVPATFVTVVLSYMVTTAGRWRVGIVIGVANLALNLLLNIVLIPHLGARGAAISTDIGEWLNVALVGAVVYSHYGVRASRGSLVPLLAASLAVLLVHLALSRIFWAYDMSAAFLVYCLILIVSGAVSVKQFRGGGNPPASELNSLSHP
jgi:O-antigen/teichoic acid export membrane protein